MKYPILFCWTVADFRIQAIGLYKWSKRPESQKKMQEALRTQSQNFLTTQSRERMSHSKAFLLWENDTVVRLQQTLLKCRWSASFNEISNYYTIAQFTSASVGQPHGTVFGFTIAALFKLDLQTEKYTISFDVLCCFIE
jgi:hypothetical protein